MKYATRYTFDTFNPANCHLLISQVSRRSKLLFRRFYEVFVTIPAEGANSLAFRLKLQTVKVAAFRQDQWVRD